MKFDMNPIPIGHLLRSIASLVKDSTRVADKAIQFSVDVKPMGTRMQYIADEVRAMSDVGQDFGNAIRDIGEDRSKRLLSRKSPDVTAVEDTMQCCRSVLYEIEKAITKATKSLASNPFNLVQYMTRQEREACGLTDVDLSILYFKVRRAVADLNLQKETLNIRIKHSGVREYRGKIREHEREISYLKYQLEEKAEALQALRERDNRDQRDESQYADADRINGEARDHGYTDTHSRRESRPSTEPVLDRRYRREWNTVPRNLSQLRSARPASSNIGRYQASKTTSNRKTAEVTGSEGLETSESVKSDAPVDLEAWQFSGPITSITSHTSKKGESCLIPASQAEILGLLDHQRKQKGFSALKQYPCLVPDVQDQIQNLIAEKEKSTGLRWSIASIDVERPKIYQRWRGQRTESAQIILQGHRRMVLISPQVRLPLSAQ